MHLKELLLLPSDSAQLLTDVAEADLDPGQRRVILRDHQREIDFVAVRQGDGDPLLTVYTDPATDAVTVRFG